MNDEQNQILMMMSKPNMGKEEKINHFYMYETIRFRIFF